MAEQGNEGQEHIEADVAGEVAGPLARGLRDSKASVTYRWLDRIKERVEVPAGDVFPSEQLLDHVPLLIEAVADFMENPSEEGTAADEVIAKAAELGEMRFDQGFSTYQVLKEFEILGGVILSQLRDRVTRLGFTPEPDHVITVSHRIHRALAKVQQATAARHIALIEERSHDLDQRLRIIRGMLEKLEDEVGDDGVASRLRGLRRLADTGISSRRRGVPLRGVVEEAVRRVRPIAAEAGLAIEVEEPLPAVEVPDAQVEHCLVIYLTNALRHCSELEGKCFVRISAGPQKDEEGVVVRVRNTGPTVQAVDDISRLAPSTDGTDAGEGGVGLRFARDVVASVGGRTWAEPAEDPAGAVFAMALPARRKDDAES